MIRGFLFMFDWRLIFPEYILFCLVHDQSLKVDYQVSNPQIRVGIPSRGYQLVIPRVAATDPSIENRGGCDCLSGLECLFNIIRALRMDSCLSAESRSPIPGSPSAIRKRKSSKKGMALSRATFDHRREDLNRIPGRHSLNGATEFASLFTQQGKKGTNQDAMVVWENFCSRNDTVFCGVFDGHGPYGHMVARKVRDFLPLRLSAHWEANLKSEEVLKGINLNSSCMNSEDTPFVSVDGESRPSVEAEEEDREAEVFQALKESFLKAFRVMDRELRAHSSVDCYCSGTTAVTLVKQGRDLVIGNVGDSRAVLGTRDKDNSLVAVQLTVDLKPNLPAEAERIKRCKGRVFPLKEEPEVSRVWLPHQDSPGLAMARAFGDFCLKEYGLIAVPDIFCRSLAERDEFIVLATDGIWDVLSNKEVIDIVGASPSRSYAAKLLVERAVRAWRMKYPTSKVDDCAVVCLFLDSDMVKACSASTTKVKEQAVAVVKAAIGKEKGNPASGTLQTGDAVCQDNSNVELSKEEKEVDDEELLQPKMNWSALEGVSRANTMMTLPGFIPGKEDKRIATANGKL